MSEFRFQVTLGGMLGLVGCAALLAWFATLILDARHAAQLSAYGNQRMTRWQAEVINEGPLGNSPDPEFLESDKPSGSLPQRGQPFP